MALIKRPTYMQRMSQDEQPQDTSTTYNPQPAPQDQSGWLSKAASATGNFFTGFAKEGASAVTKAARLGTSIGDLAYAALDPNVTYSQLQEQNKGGAFDRGTTRSDFLTPKGTAQKVGAGAEQVAEFFLPGMGELSGVKALEASRAAMKARGAGQIASKIIPRLAQMGTEGATTLGITSLQRGEVKPESLREAAYSALTAPLGKIPQMALGASQVGQGVYQIAEGDTAAGATNFGLGLAQIWSGTKTKGALLDEPTTLIKGNPQVSGDIEGMRQPVSSETLPTARQRAGAKIAESVIRPTKADVDAGYDVKNVAKYDVLRGDLAETLDETQRRIAGYNNIVKQVVQKSGDPMVIDGKKVLTNVKKNLAGEGTSLSSEKYKTILDDVEKSLDTFIPDWKTRKLSVTEGMKLRREAGKQAVFHHDPLNKGENALREKAFNDIYMGMKHELDSNLPPQFKGANEAMSELIPIQQAIMRRIPVADRQNLLGLTDSMTTLASIFDPRALAFGAISRATKSPTVARALMQSGPVPKPFMPGDIPEAPNYPRLPAPGDIPYRAPDVIQLPPRAQSTMASRVPDNFPQYTPQQAEQLRLKSLEEVAARAKDMPIMSRQKAYQDHNIMTMQAQMPVEPPAAPNMLAPRSVGEYTPQPATPASIKAEAMALKQQLKQFSYPDKQMEFGYKEFKQIARRSSDILDDVMDSDAFIKKYGKDKYRTIIENSVAGGGMTNNELLDAYRVRYQTEQAMEQQIERISKNVNKNTP